MIYQLPELTFEKLNKLQAHGLLTGGGLIILCWFDPTF